MTDTCGVCHRPLLDPLSRAAGIGPVCAEKFHPPRGRRTAGPDQLTFEEHHVDDTTPSTGQQPDTAPVDRAAVLTDRERQFLVFALDLAVEELSLGAGFTDEDRAALDRLRRMADEAQQPTP